MIYILKYRYLIFVLIISFFLFLPSFSTFFTHDDFFHLLIAKPGNLANFVSFFDITQNHQGYMHFRPLTTQFFYSFGWLFNLNPLPLHLLMFMKYVLVCILVYKLFLMLGLSSKMAKVGLFLYATSANHFGRLYFLSTQEFGYALFTILSVISYIKYGTSRNKAFYWLSFLSFFLSLLSKETALITPFLIIGVTLYLELKELRKYSLREIVKCLLKYSRKLLPFYLLAGIYLYFRIFYYGLATGDSYIWDFSVRVFNTLFWYGLWSLNLPEMIVDFVGPGINLNPNLLKFWSKEIIPVFILLMVQIFVLITLLIKNVTYIRKSLPLLFFALFWFCVSLLPVLFLPLHKFSFYLTLALVGVVLTIVSLLENAGKKTVILFCVLWLVSSFFTLKLTEKTHWVTRGAQTAKSVNDYLQDNKEFLAKYSKIAFIDTEKDSNLPWKPSEIVRSSLSDQNYFKVFYPGQFNVYYGYDNIPEDALKIEARQFTGH